MNADDRTPTRHHARTSVINRQRLATTTRTLAKLRMMVSLRRLTRKPAGNPLVRLRGLEGRKVRELRRARSARPAGAVHAAVFGARPERFDHAFLQGFPCAEHAHAGVAGREATRAPAFVAWSSRVKSPCAASY